MAKTEFETLFEKGLAARPRAAADDLVRAVQMKVDLERIRARAIAEAVRLGTAPKIALEELAEPSFEKGLWGPFDHNWPDDDAASDAFFEACDDFNDKWARVQLFLDSLEKGSPFYV